MKKLTLVLLVIASLILGAMTMASCDASDLPFELPFDVPFLACEHEYVEEVTKAATCTEEGVKTLTCSKCGEVAEEAIPALGHDFATKYTTDVAATCTAEGSKSYHCSRCDAKDGVKVISKLDHMWSENLVEIEPVTCTVNGKRGYVCEECQAVDESRIDVLYAGGHTMDLFWTVDLAMDCKNGTAGWESRHCQVCDHTEEGREIAVAHDWGNWEVALKETCTTDGYKARKCTVCEQYDSENQEVIKAHHTFGDETTVVQSTIYSKGSITGPCKDCQTVFTEETESTVYLIDAQNIDKMKIGVKEGNNGHWAAHKYINELTEETGKEFYPTAEDTVGNDLYIEASILINETMNSANDAYVFYCVMGRSSPWARTIIADIDPVGALYDDAAMVWVQSNSTATDPASLVTKDTFNNKATGIRVELGWHRFTTQIHQDVIAKDAGGNVLTLVNGQLADPTQVIASLTYKWIGTFYMDGVMIHRFEYEGFATGSGKPGIWNKDNVIYSAEISEDGHSIIYGDCPNDETSAQIRWENGIRTNSTTLFPIADVSFTMGKAPALAVTPVDYKTKYNFAGGKVAKTFEVADTETKFQNIYYFNTTDAPVATPDPVLEKAGYDFAGWVDVDGVRTATWTRSATHDQCVTEGEKTLVYNASIFASGLKTFTCDICGETAEEEIPQLTPNKVRASGNKSIEGSDNLRLVYDKPVSDYYNQSAKLGYASDFIFELSFLSNKTMDKIAHRPLLFQINKTDLVQVKLGSSIIVKNVYNSDTDTYNDKEVAIEYGWHRIAYQIREFATIVDEGGTPAVQYGLKLRVFLDGENTCTTGDGWYTIKWNDSFKFFSATVNAEDNTKLDYAAADSGIRIWIQDFFNKSKNYNYQLALPMDSFELYGKEIDRSKELTYAETFKMDVTPVKFNLGEEYTLGTSTWHLTQRTTDDKTADYDYELPTISYFHVTGTAPNPDPVLTREGFIYNWTDVEGVRTANWTVAHEHNPVEKTEEYKAPQCEIAGEKVYYCSICNMKTTEPVTALQHSFGDPVVKVPATIFAAGKQQKTCTLCTTKVVEEEVAQKTPSNLYSSNVNAANALSIIDTDVKNFVPIDENSTALDSYSVDFFVEFSYLVNNTTADADDSAFGGQSLNLVFKPNGKSDLVFLQVYQTAGEVWMSSGSGRAFNGGSDVVLVPGWHRIAIQVRQSAAAVSGAVAYTTVAKLYIDGSAVSANWIPVAASKWVDAKFFNATINADNDTKIDVSALDANALKFQFKSADGYKNTKSVLIPLDSIFVNAAKTDDTKTAYGDLFEMNVTAIGNVAAYKDGDTAVTFALDDGTLPTKTYAGTAVVNSETVAQNYELTNLVFFQPVGCAASPAPVAVKDGYTFTGWSWNGFVFTANFTQDAE